MPEKSALIDPIRSPTCVVGLFYNNYRYRYHLSYDQKIYTRADRAKTVRTGTPPSRAWRSNVARCRQTSGCCNHYGVPRIMMNEQKLALWDRFCREHRIWETGVPLFACDDGGRVASAPFGKDCRPILRRSPDMEAR